MTDAKEENIKSAVSCRRTIVGFYLKVMRDLIVEADRWDLEPKTSKFVVDWHLC